MKDNCGLRYKDLIKLLSNLTEEELEQRIILECNWQELILAGKSLLIFTGSRLD